MMRFNFFLIDRFNQKLNYKTEGSSMLSVLRYFLIVMVGVFFVLSTQNGLSQTYFFDNYKTTEGMESSKVFDMCQSRDGLIWLGTDVGISSFDGAHFMNYTIKNGLSKGGVRSLVVDDGDMLWLGHEGGGITRYNGKMFEIIDKVPISSNITSFCNDHRGNLWITTYENGAFKIKNPKDANSNLEWQQYTGKDLSDMLFNSMVAKDGKLSMITDIGIKQYDSASDKFVRFSSKNLDTYFQFSVMFEDSHRNIWYGTYNGGLYKQEPDGGAVTYYDVKNGLASNWITDIIEDRHGNIWIGHWDLERKGGLTRISSTGVIKVFDQSNGLHDNKVWCLLEDSEGNILIGTTEHGLDIFKGEKFVTYSTQNGLINNQVNAIVQDDNGNYWIGTNEGISVLNPASQNMIHFDQQQNQISNLIRFLKIDKNMNIWIGTEDQGVQLFDVIKRHFVSMPEINERLPRVSKSVLAMEVDHQNQLWIGTLGGLMLFDIKSGLYVKMFGQLDGLPSNEIKSLYCDEFGVMWVGTKNGGISYWSNNKFNAIAVDEKITPTAIVSVGKSNIALGTEAHGVFVIDRDGKVVHHYTIDEGLFTNSIRFLIADEESNIFVGTTVGLNKITSNRETVLAYNKHNGFVGIECRQNAAYKDADGQLWMGTVQGVTYYNPAADLDKPIIPIPHIISFQVNGEAVDVFSQLEFPSFQNNVSVSYGSISISDPSSVTYQIMLDGADKDWQKVGSDKSANYRALPPGKYVFKVKAVNSFGMADETPAAIPFEILAPIYQRPWFVTSSIILLVISIFLFIKMRERNLIREKKLLAKRVMERTHELSVANVQLASKNKDITDSIQYAKRIQVALLPNELPYGDTFVLFKPKDIVSGDFYWATQSHGKEFLAVVDCTGHGVPGAFMSVIGHTSLNKIVIEKGIYTPSEILMQLNKEVEFNFHQKENDIVNDGMDMALISYDSQTRLLEYAGANNPLWLIRNGEMIEIKASRHSIGRSVDGVKAFQNHQLLIEPNDMVYIFSDGYADQFGGADGKKFKIAKMRQLLLSHHQLPTVDQQKILDETIISWMGDLDQVDDILVAGRRFM